MKRLNGRRREKEEEPCDVTREEEREEALVQACLVS